MFWHLQEPNLCKSGHKTFSSVCKSALFASQVITFLHLLNLGNMKHYLKPAVVAEEKWAIPNTIQSANRGAVKIMHWHNIFFSIFFPLGQGNNCTLFVSPLLFRSSLNLADSCFFFYDKSSFSFLLVAEVCVLFSDSWVWRSSSDLHILKTFKSIQLA